MSRRKPPFGKRLLSTVLVVVFLPVVLPLVILTLTLALLHRASLWLLVQFFWLPRGKDVLLVYSDSPIWRDYIMNEIAPWVAERAVMLNWSERRLWRWWSLSVNVFRSYGRGREYNPMILLFRPMGRTRVFRFWSAFQDQKRGDTEPLGRLKQELFVAL